MPGLQGADSSDRAQFSHPPDVQYRYAVGFLKGVQHGRGTGRTTNDAAFHAGELLACFFQVTKKVLPHSRDTSGQCHPLGFEQFE
ncbi:hypothetical protein D3C86_2050580 [compost metagenome]